MAGTQQGQNPLLTLCGLGAELHESAIVSPGST